jgi:hypothetical protein
MREGRVKPALYSTPKSGGIYPLRAFLISPTLPFRCKYKEPSNEKNKIAELGND